jgi:hypothetical protein
MILKTQCATKSLKDLIYHYALTEYFEFSLTQADSE